jgi:hypothetical protein
MRTKVLLATALCAISATSSHAVKATTKVAVVTYADLVSGTDYVFVRFEDKMIQMALEPVEPGPVFVSMHGEAGSYRWRLNEGLGVLSWLGPEASAQGKTLYEECRESNKSRRP